MANTCEGSLRIRGPKDNIQRFLLNGLEPHNSTKKLEIKDGDILFFYLVISKVQKEEVYPT